MSPEEVEAPNGVRAVEHRLDGESRVRAEAGASHTVEAPTGDGGGPVEVQVGAGGLWVSVPPGGAEVQVNHGGFSALVSNGAVMVDAGEGSDGLLLVSSGEVLLVDSAGTSRMLTAGEAAVLGVDGDLAGVDEVGEDELVGDPWAAANRALDAEIVLPVVAEPDEDELIDEDEADELVDADEDLDEDELEPEPAGDHAGVIVTTAVAGPDEDEGEPWPPSPEEPDADRGELLDELYAPGDLEAHEVSGRSIARILEVAALVVFIGVAVLLVFLFNRDDDDPESTEIANPVTTIRPTTTTEDPTTSSSGSASTTEVPTTVKINIKTCTQRGEALVAAGSVEGAPASAEGYRITVEVVLGNRKFGRKTVTVPRGDNEDGRRSWTAEIPLSGDAVGAGAKCEIADEGVTLV